MMQKERWLVLVCNAPVSCRIFAHQPSASYFPCDVSHLRASTICFSLSLRYFLAHLDSRRCVPCAIAVQAGARAFADVCAANAVYEDCYMSQPITGPTAIREHMMFKVGQRKGKDDAGFRIDMISDGDGACGFAWTWTCGDEEGLRGTTFVELNDAGEIQFVREIPEPLFKPGDATKDLLQAVTAGIEPTPKPDFESQTPTTASGIARYLYEEVQGGSIDEAMRFFSPDVEYRDFNYEEMLNGKEEVRKFVEDFSFPGITFRPQRFDDGVLSTCFCWEVVIADAPETIKGMSLYSIDPGKYLKILFFSLSLRRIYIYLTVRSYIYMYMYLLCRMQRLDLSIMSETSQNQQ